MHAPLFQRNTQRKRENEEEEEEQRERGFEREKSARSANALSRGKVLSFVRF